MSLNPLFYLKCRDDLRARQIFAERTVHFFTLGTLTKQTTLYLKNTTPLSFILYHIKVPAKLFNAYFVNFLGDAGETTKMDYSADFIEHPSIRALKHNKAEKETFRIEPVNSSL